MKGTVKFYNASKGFGFITAEDGKEYFMHVSGFKEGMTELNDNDPVTFDVVQGDRGPKAENVALDQGGAEEPAEEAEEPAEEDSEEPEESEEEPEDDSEADEDSDEEEKEE